MFRKLEKLFSKKKKIVFMYSPQHREGGSTTMRGFQLSQITKKHLGDKYIVEYLPIGSWPRNSTIFMPKMTIFMISFDQLMRLRKLGNIIVFDPIDEKIPDEKLQFADSVMAASREAYSIYSERYPDKKIVLVDHHVDPRIHPSSNKPNVPNIGYFGEPANTIITPAIEEYVEIIRVDTSSQKNMEWLNKIPSYNIHYAVRKSRDQDDCKPATKVFTAARCGANIIIQDTEKEAMYWLGSEYPYVIRGEATEEKIIKMLKYAQGSYGSLGWNKALKIMREINNRVSDVNIASQVELIASQSNRRES